jgi:uncharacterized protein
MDARISQAPPKWDNMSEIGQPQISPEDEERIRLAIAETLLTRPPTIGIVGVSGTGKSSTLNAMFKTDLPVSDVVACTKEFRDVDLRVQVTAGHGAGEGTVLRVVDAPGLGEDIARDPQYLAMYLSNLGNCDVVLWVMTARNRAIALDQLYLQKLEIFHDRMVFGINQVDIVEPMDWNVRTHLPSVRQEANIQTIIDDRRQKLASVVGHDVRVYPYSAKYRYGLQELFTTLIESCAEDRAWIFDAIRNFGPFDFLPEAARSAVMARLGNENSDGKA